MARGVVLQGGFATGLAHCSVLFDEDLECGVHSIECSELRPAPTAVTPESLGLSNSLVAQTLIAQQDNKLLKQAVLKICARMQWAEWASGPAEEVTQFLNIVKGSAAESPAEHSVQHWQEVSLQTWEHLVDLARPLFLLPAQESPTVSFEGFFLSPEEDDEGIANYSIPPSSYIALPTQLSKSSDSTNFKMLKYWENHIIPRIQDYVRSSFRPYEMDEFFEQLRRPLRIGDQQEGIRIAQVLCDKRLPTGISLPSERHDWNSLMVDEIVVGDYALLKLREKDNQNSPLHKLSSLGLTQFTVKLRACDSRAAAALVEYLHTQKSEIHLFWTPVSSLYPLEAPVHKPGNYKTIHSSYAMLEQRMTALSARETLLQCMSLKLNQHLSVIELIKAALIEELGSDRIEGWAKHRLDYIPGVTSAQQSVANYIHSHAHTKGTAQKLDWIEQNLIPSSLHELVEWAVAHWHALSTELARNIWVIDIIEMSNTLSGEQKPLQNIPENITAEGSAAPKYFPLHLTEDASSGVALTFHKDSFLCSNSTLKFYSDSEGRTLIYEITAGLKGKANIPPILFKTGKVWCTYATYVDIKCSPYFNDFAGPSVLKCRVHGIPQEWTQLCWITETVSSVLVGAPSAEHVQLMHSFTGAICEVLSTSKASTAVRQILFRLLTRLVRRLRYMNSTVQLGLGIGEQWLQGLIEETKQWVNSEYGGSGTLYSSYIQDLVELITSCLLPCDIYGPAAPALQLKCPEYIQAAYKTLLFLNYFRKEGALTAELHSEIKTALEHDQWKAVLVLSNVPEDSHEKLLTVLAQCKLRVPHVAMDIQHLGTHCVIFGDGLSLQYYQETEFGEEHKGPEPLPEDSKQPELWECLACTYKNTHTLGNCEICGSPRPVEAPATAAEELPHNSVKDTETKLQDNCQEAYQELLKTLCEALQCQAALLSAEHSELLRAALLRRAVSGGTMHEVLLKSFESSWVHLRDVLGEDFNEAKATFVSKAQEDALGLFRVLEERGVDLWLQYGSIGAPQRLNVAQLESLVELVEFKACQETRAALYIPAASLRLPMENITSLCYTQEYIPKELSDFSLVDLRYNWATLKVFNQYISEAIGLCNVSQYSLLPQGSYTLSLSSALSECRGLVMLPIKTEMQQIVFRKTAVNRENIPNVAVERMKIIDSHKKMPIFHRALEQLKHVHPDMLRPPKPQGADPFIAFTVSLKGEEVVGEGGPYRQLFADISRELQQEDSDFLIPTPNDLGKEHSVVNKFLVKPSAVSSQQLAAFEFLGLLMGCCIRTGAKMALDLPSFFWKPLVGQNLAFYDLDNIDSAAASKLRTIEESQSGFYEKFNFKTSEQTTVSLIPTGKSIAVTSENKDLYIGKALKLRFEESLKQAQRIRAGLAKLVPTALLNLSTWRQIEEWVCGKHHIDLELLRRHSRLSGGLCETDNRVLWFWEILTEFTPAERLKFIKFTWGQERLPVNDEEFENNSIRLMLKPAVNEKYGDSALPKADTCFFNFELPNYSTKEVMKERVRYAILTDCEALFGDEHQQDDEEVGMGLDHNYGEEE